MHVVSSSYKYSAPEDRYFIYQNYCMNYFLEYKDIKRYLTNPLIDYDKVVQEDAKKRKNELEGYDIVGFGNLGDIKIEQPYFKVVGTKSRTDMKVLLLGAPLIQRSDRQKYWYIVRAGYMPMGIMSFRSWPRRIPEELDDYTMEAIDTGMRDIVKTFTGWLHCANDTYIYFNHTLIPRLLFSESDIQWRVVHNYYDWNKRTTYREFDLVFVNPGTEKWHNDTKNFPLACKCFPKLIDELGLRIMISGRKPCIGLEGKVSYIEGMVNFETLLDYFHRSKILFVPAISDASPRIIP